MRGGGWLGGVLTEAQLNFLRFNLKKRNCDFAVIPVAGVPNIMQYPEESLHPLQFYESITDDEGKVEKYLIPDPPKGWDSVLNRNGDLKSTFKIEGLKDWSYLYSSTC